MGETIADGRAHDRARLAPVALSACGVLAYLATGGSSLGPAVGGVIVLTSVAAMVVGLRVHVRPGVPRWSLTLSGLLFTVGVVLRGAGAEAGPGPFGVLTSSHLYSFAGYLLLTVFLVSMVRRLRARTGTLLLMDAAIVTVGLAIVAWTLWISPSLDASAPVQDRVLNAAYVGVDVLLLALAVQLALRKAVQIPAFWMLLAGLCCLLVGDLGYASAEIGLLSVPEFAIAVWHLAAFTMLASMSVHPSCADLFVATPSVTPGLQRSRLVALFGALLAPTVLLTLRAAEDDLDFWVRFAAFVALVTLVFARGWLTAVRLAESRAHSQHQADHDGLTGLLSRSALLTAIQRRLGGGGPLHVLFLDVDGFKWVNDTWGHAAGDSVLVQAADRLRAVTGSRTVGRVGGDEFVVVSADPDPRPLAEAIRACFTEAFELPQSGPLVLSCSVGVVTADEGATLESLMSDADIAMYSVKDDSRDAVGYFTPQMRSVLTERARIRQALVGALERDELAVYLQPILDGTEDARPAGFEALLRWERPGIGFVPPCDFIPVAEESNVLVEIGHWVLAEACVQTARLRDELGLDLFVSVNLSARQLQDPALEGAVLDAVALSGLPADAVWVEITETTMVRNAAAACANIEALRRHGVRFALDDFGTGFASLSYLHDFDCQVVKVDRSFVSRLDDPSSSEPIVHAIVAMTHALGMIVVAEGVETEAQARRLRTLGVDYLQGYLLGRPAPAADHLGALAHPA